MQTGILEEIVIASIAILTFVVAGVFDWRNREVDPRIWIAPIVVGIIFNFFYITFQAYDKTILLFQIGIAAFFVLTIAILVFVVNLLGGADFMAISTFVALYPFNRLAIAKSVVLGNRCVFLFNLFPPVLWLLAIYSMIMLFIIIRNVIHNLFVYRSIKEMRIPIHKKVFYMAFNRFMTVDEYMRKRFYYPVYVPGVVDRVTFDIYEDDADWKKKLGVLPKDTIIVVSWGIPMVSFLSISATIYIVMYVLFYLSIA